MDEQKRLFSPRTIVQLMIVVILIPFLPLLVSWRWDWWEAWIFGIVYVLGFVISRLLVAQRHPDLLAERAHSLEQENAKQWDRVLAPIVALGGAVLLLVAGLDMRFHWSAGFGLPFKVTALVLIVAGYAFGTYAMLENRFFSGLVRIQTERGHHVVSTGPYHWVRHPGYVGAALTYLATPVFLDAAWAFVPAVLLMIALVIRTRLEDQTLQAELPGYAAYAQRVRYRLLPGVW
ncbi:MAG: isoprenylcysteine carboxylmethyltransferase family protein [Anaerolineales bacterium]|nr:isoprenylcysteine carboxylmethyltransferase family protein [Anaerolineales bacterium]